MRQVRSQQTSIPQIRETDRQVKRITAHATSNRCRNQCWVGKPGLELGNCLRLSVDHHELENAGGSSYAGAPRFCDFYLLGFYQVLTVNIGEKFPCTSAREREEEPF